MFTFLRKEKRLFLKCVPDRNLRNTALFASDDRGGSAAVCCSPAALFTLPDPERFAALRAHELSEIAVKICSFFRWNRNI
ncbi:MAG: hypothetical protein J6Z45_01345 [Oscillospiraceae bacterium]|nr:hypothetical protein [Oscillospiraceae bacterium]